MFSRKKQESNDTHQKKKYQFIREQVRPQRKKQILGLVRWLGIAVVFACVFGGVAGAIILHMQKQYTESESDVTPINTYSMPPAQTASPSDENSAKEEDKSDTQNSDSNQSEKKDSKSGITLNKFNRLSERIAEIGTKAGSAIVGVKRKSSDQNWFISNQNKEESVAFGLIVQETQKKFFIITTCDILNGQSAVEIQLVNDVLIEGEILGCDAQMNLAAVSIEKKDIDQSVLQNMSVAVIGNGYNLKKGTNVIAIGCPDGVLGSVVTGSITNNNISAPITDGEVELFNTDMLYSNASNGVILDLDSKVVGFITTEFVEITGMTGLSFVNISSVSDLLERLQNKKGIPYMGCEGQSISETIAKSHSLEAGAYITDVYADSPAYNSGMRVADIITKMDGESITSMSDIYQILIRHKKGDTLKYTVSRKSGKKQVSKELTIKLG